MAAATGHQHRPGVARSYVSAPAFTRRLGVIAAAATFLMLLAMTAGTAAGARAILESQSEQRFAGVVDGASNSVRADLQRGLTDIAALTAFLHTEENLTRDTFQIFASSIMRGSSSAEALGFAPGVPVVGVNGISGEMEQGSASQGSFEGGQQGVMRFPVAYVFPPLERLVEPGEDIASDPRFGTAVQQSLRGRTPAVTGPLTLTTNPSAEPRILVIQPVFGQPEPGQLPSDGPLRGYAFSVYRTADFLSGPLERNNLSDLPLRVFDAADGRSSSMIFPDHDPLADSMLQPGWVESTVPFAGRRWTLQFKTPERFGLSALERNVWVIVLSAGLGLTVFASVSMFSLLRSRSAAHSDLDLATSQIRVIVGSAIEGIVVIDEADTLLLANRSFADAFGLPDPDLLTGRDWGSVRESASVELEDRNGFFSAMSRLSSSPGVTESSRDVRITAPEQRTLSMSSSPVNDGSGDYIGRLFVFRDVTAERSAEEAKTDFISMVSHELRTPLTSIVGYIELLLEGAGGGLSTESTRLLSVIRRNSNRLARLVEDILDLARIDNARFDLEPSEVDVPGLLQELVEAMSREFRGRRQTVRLVLEGDIPLMELDRVRISQVFSNLLTNAHRYTPDGGQIIVSAGIDDEKLVVSVKDNGVGISHEDHERIFQRFARISPKDGNGGRPNGSTGLGLAITKALVELHGGTVGVESAPGEGSRFTVCIPVTFSEGSRAA